MAYTTKQLEQRRQQLIGGSNSGGSGSTSQFFQSKRQDVYSNLGARLPVVKSNVSDNIQVEQTQPNLLSKVGSAINQLPFAQELIQKSGIDFNKNLKILKEITPKYLKGQLKTSGGLLGQNIASNQKTMANFFNMSPIWNNPVNQLISKQLEKVSPGIREQGVKEQNKASQEMAKLPPAKNLQQQVAESLVFNLPSMATSYGLTIATAAITKNPLLASAVGLSTSFGFGANEAYMEARNFGLSDKEAQPYALLGGTMIGAIDAIPLVREARKSGVIKPLQKSFARNLVRGMISSLNQAGLEGGSEAIQQIIGNALSMTYNKDKKLFDGAGLAGLVGFFGGAVMDIPSSVISSFQGDVSTQEIIDNINEKVDTAVKTPKNERTTQQQMIVDAMTTQTLTPDDVFQYVTEGDLTKSQEGKDLIKTALEAKSQGKNIEVKLSEKGAVESTTLIDKDIVPVEAPTQPETKPVEVPAKKGKAQEIVSEKIVETETTKRPPFSSKEARAVSESFREEIDRAIHDAKDETDLYKIIPLVDAAIEKAKGSRAALSGIRTEVSKQMFGIAGATGGSYKDNYMIFKSMQSQGDFGRFLQDMENRVQTIDEELKTTKEISKVVTKTKTKETKVRDIPKPVGSAKKKAPKAALRVEAKAIEKGLDINLEAMTKTQRTTVIEQEQKALDLIAKDRQKAIDIALGLRSAPEGTLTNSIFTEVVNMAMKERNTELLQQLTLHDRPAESTRYGQEIQYLSQLTKNDPIGLLNEIVKIRQEMLSKRTGKSHKDLVKSEKKKILGTIEQPDVQQWNKFLKEIEC